MVSKILVPLKVGEIWDYVVLVEAGDELGL